MTLISVLSVTTLHAADGNDAAVGNGCAPSQSEPSVSDKVAKNILSFTHISGDKLSTNFLAIALLQPNDADKKKGNSACAKEWYGLQTLFSNTDEPKKRRRLTCQGYKVKVEVSG